MFILLILLLILIIFSAKYPWWLPTKKGLIVLMYHHIYKYDNTCDLAKELYVEPEVFSKQMDFLLKHKYTPITLEELSKAYKDSSFKLPKKTVLITFDDGWLDNYTNAFRILKEKNIKANIFVSCNFIEQKNCMTWKQLLEMKNSGLISFGSHTITHPTDIQTLNDDKILQELKDSKQQLEQKLNIKIDSFAYPYGKGATNKKIRNMVFDSGYLFDFSTKRGINPFKWNKEKALKRLYIKQGYNLFDFYLLISKGKNSF
jgi:peptidoglycan/xylan/chitin deacetylase (PgdA/CDA1 family)